MQKKILLFAALTATMLISKAQTGTWKLTGNSGTSANTNFLGTTDNKPIVFKTNDSEKARLTGTGRLGIGIKTPDAKLQVDKGTYVSLSNPGYLILGNSTSYNLGIDYDVIQARYNGTPAALYLNYYGGSTYLGSSATVAISSTGVLTSGLTGINGAASSVYALNVSPSSSGGINVEDGVDAYSLNATKSGVLAGVLVTKSSATSVDACVWGNSTGSAYGVRGNSSTGIGVYGVTNNSSSYAGYFSGNVYTTGSYLPSDLTLKKNVKDLTKAIDIINQLHPKTYQYKDDGDYKSMNLPAGNRYGLISEDVEKVLPGLVKQTSFQTGTDATIKSGKSTVITFKALNYTELIPVLIKGMQEQQQQIQTQQQQIDELKQMVQTLTTGKSILNANSVAGYLQQNTPNPFTQNTLIRCSLPSSVQHAQLVVYSADGKPIKTYSLNNKGMNEVNISAGTLPAGQYVYSLLADGKNLDTKYMVLTK